MRDRLIDSVKAHEGLKLRSYKDTLGHLTIGYGTNLEHLVIDQETAEEWLIEDLEDIQERLCDIAGFSDMSMLRQDTLTEMAYQLGVGGMLSFRRMWAAIRAKDWNESALEMLDSRWARDQTPRRAQTLARRIKTNIW